jgi:MerR family Zn(II)-responsive transcriptional regulator of zntA
VPPAERTRAGYRDYGPEAVARVDFIHRGQAAGLTLAQIRQILEIREAGRPPCEHVRDLLDDRLSDLDVQLERLLALRDSIAELREQAELLAPETCTDAQICRYL